MNHFVVFLNLRNGPSLLSKKITNMIHSIPMCLSSFLYIEELSSTLNGLQASHANSNHNRHYLWHCKCLKMDKHTRQFPR